MAETNTKLPMKSEGSKSTAATAWHPFDDLRREVDRLFEGFNGGWPRPFRPPMPTLGPLLRSELDWSTPAVDIVEKDKSYEINVELPGIDEQNVDVTLRNGNIVIKGEKQEDKEEKSKDYYLRERQFGSFERAFAVPEGVETDKIDASFKKGVLTITLPKAPTAQNSEKKISVKRA